MYICPDAIGVPFWKANGYMDSGKIDPDARKPIYIKEIAVPADFTNSRMIALTKDTAAQISQWEYEKPFDVYNFKGRPNGYLMDASTWGTEQFCLVDRGRILGQVSCQFKGTDLWVGWSMVLTLCKKGNGAAFAERCVHKISAVKNHTGRILLRVATWNQRAIKAYQKAGFVHVETIQDAIAYTDHVEDFRVMVHENWDAHLFIIPTQNKYKICTTSILHQSNSLLSKSIDLFLQVDAFHDIRP